MNDVYGLFVRKAAESTADPIALSLALNYMLGFVDSEVMHIKGGGKNPKETGEAIGMLYSLKCMKHLMPK